MYVADDPRAKLAPTGPAVQATRFAPAEYFPFHQLPPQILHPRTWIARARSFVVAYTEAQPGAQLESQVPDEHMLLIPHSTVSATVEAGEERVEISGATLTVVPPGPSRIQVHSRGTLVRIFSACDSHLRAQAINAAAHATPHPTVPPYQPWPAPPAGYRVRVYSLDVPPEPGRFGRIWRCSTLMINVHPLEPGPRDLTRLSPHHHEDFEQGSLALAGAFTHHIRWPWTPDIHQWREDEHVSCPAPSLAVIPPPAIHTSAGSDPTLNHLVDIFAPPRLDFSKQPGWVLNAADYPMPPEAR